MYKIPLVKEQTVLLRACAYVIKVSIGQSSPGLLTLKMASANSSFTKDGLIYRPHHFEDDDDDEFLTGNSQKDGGIAEETHVAAFLNNGRGRSLFRNLWGYTNAARTV